MRTLLIGALAATLVGCSCLLPPQAEKPSSAHARDRDHLATKTAKSTMIPAKVEPPASGQPAGNAAASSTTTGANIASSPPTGGTAAGSNTRTTQEQVTAAIAVAEHVTAATAVPAPEQKLNNTDRSGHSKTLLGGDAEKTAPTSNNTDHLVAILMARPEIKSVSDLANKNVAIDGRQSASVGSVRTAIVTAGAAEVQLSEGQTKAIDRVISGEVPAAVLTLVSPEAAEWFPEIAGFKIFRIPLSPRSAVR